MNDASKGYAVFFNDITDDAEVGEDYPVGTIGWDETLQVLYVRTASGWQFISAQVP